MDLQTEEHYLKLAAREGWETRSIVPKRRSDPRFSVQVREHTFPLCHPYQVHITLYRRESDPGVKFAHMKAAHDWLWPSYIDTWNSWEEERFRAHCSGYEYIVLAGPAASSKSLSAAKIVMLFYLAGVISRSAVVCSTTAESLESRIWGYIQELANTSRLPLPIKILEGKPPKILPLERSGKIYGIFATAIRTGEDAKVISTLIGRHSKGGVMLILDEATDMSAAIIKSAANLKKGTDFFQLIGIGNSNSKNDLHGALSTPLRGWGSIDPLQQSIWETTHENGICIYANPYKSPAITDPDPVKRALLAKFFPTLESIESDKRIHGENSESFWRFTLGLWKSQDIDNTISTPAFLSEHEIFKGAEWSGFFPIEVVAGLDPAFQYGGSGCVLRLAYFGHTVNELMALDFRQNSLLFRIGISPNSQKSAELQLVEQVLDIIAQYNCPLYRLAVDVTGAGTALAELLRQVARVSHRPIKVMSNANSKVIGTKKDDPQTIVGRPTEYWFKFKEFVQQRQIKGLDSVTIAQFSNRLVVQDQKRLNSMRLETKWEYRARMTAINPKLAHSPDEADAAVLAVISAMISFGFHPGMRRTIPADTKDMTWFHKIQSHLHGANRAAIEDQGRRNHPLLPNFSAGVENVVSVPVRWTQEN